MAFTPTVVETTVFGNKRIAWGTYTNGGGSTGGDILTGLNKVDVLQLQPTGAAVVANAPSVNGTFPIASGTVTVVNTANEVGQWMAIGD